MCWTNQHGQLCAGWPSGESPTSNPSPESTGNLYVYLFHVPRILRPSCSSPKEEYQDSKIDREERNKVECLFQLLQHTRVKIPLSSEFLVHLSGCVYFCIFNGLVDDGLTALDEIHNRAKLELFPDVLLVVFDSTRKALTEF